MSALPPPGRWALGREAQGLAEPLLLQAQRQGLRTAWLGQEATFLSNLSILENLRLLHEWQGGSAAAFAHSLREAAHCLQLERPEWLHQRPAQLREAQLLEAGLLRTMLVRPEVLVLQPEALQEAGPLLSARLVSAFTEARLLLLAEPSPDWPAWPQLEPATSPEELSA